MADVLFDDLFNPRPDPEADAIFAKRIPRTTPALDGLTDPVLDAIVAEITPEMVRAFVAELAPTPRKAEQIRRALVGHRWFPSDTTRDTQLRFMRTLRDAAIAAGYPVCSLNDGLVLGTRALVEQAAARARALAEGALARADALTRLAARMEPMR